MFIGKQGKVGLPGNDIFHIFHFWNMKNYLEAIAPIKLNLSQHNLKLYLILKKKSLLEMPYSKRYALMEKKLSNKTFTLPT